MTLAPSFGYDPHKTRLHRTSKAQLYILRTGRCLQSALTEGCFQHLSGTHLGGHVAQVARPAQGGVADPPQNGVERLAEPTDIDVDARDGDHQSLVERRPGHYIRRTEQRAHLFDCRCVGIDGRLE